MVGHRALTVLDNKHNWKENIAASRTIVNYQTIIETGQEGISWYEQPHSDLNSLTRPVTVRPLPRNLVSQERKILSAAGSRALGPESARQTQLTVKFPSIALV